MGFGCGNGFVMPFLCLFHSLFYLGLASHSQVTIGFDIFIPTHSHYFHYSFSFSYNPNTFFTNPGITNPHFSFPGITNPGIQIPNPQPNTPLEHYIYSKNRNPKGMVIVIVLMGVSGAGKSTIGEMLAKVMNLTFLDADDFHPKSNKEKMSKGIPLTDEDRIPWLEKIRDVLEENIACGKCVVLGCSALKKQYREILRSSDPKYEIVGNSESCVKFVLLDAPAEVIAARLEKRLKEGKHFMASSLLKSQLDLLQIDDSEGIFKVNATLSPQAIVNDIHRLVF